MYEVEDQYQSLEIGIAIIKLFSLIKHNRSLELVIFKIK